MEKAADTLPQNQGKLDTRGTDEDLDGRWRITASLFLPVRKSIGGTEECSLSRVKELHVQKYYNDFFIRPTKKV